jgi:hypothetical protein
MEIGMSREEDRLGRGIDKSKSRRIVGEGCPKVAKRVYMSIGKGGLLRILHNQLCQDPRTILHPRSNFLLFPLPNSR